MLANAQRQTTFYITESSAFRNRVLYFRHDDWSTLCAPLVEKLSSDTFQRIEQVRVGDTSQRKSVEAYHSSSMRHRKS